ncbi:hypothetical protein TWF481_006739 [Arthrobotrys musiformis]|uniref:Uncharacterized protein n=1 Tax=Arthrobotrys musiformis TaxID=47236 RepID=A0AAV9WBA1_9PEZI
MESLNTGTYVSENAGFQLEEATCDADADTVTTSSESKPLQATLDGRKWSAPSPPRTSIMSTILLPDMLATPENYESIREFLPEPLQDIIHFSDHNTWWVDGYEVPHDLTIPIQIAQRVVLVRGWTSMFNFNLIDDPLPGYTTAQLIEDDRVDKVLAECGAKAFLFLMSGVVLLLYDSYLQIKWNFENIPPYIAGYSTAPTIGNIVPTPDGPSIGRSVQLEHQRTSSACVGVTVRRKSDGQLFNTIPTHLPHMGFIKDRWMPRKLLDYFLPRPVPVESFGQISYRSGSKSQVVRDVSATFDTELTTQNFPTNYSHDLSLIATDTALDSGGRWLKWSSQESPPFGKLARLLNLSHPRTGISAPQHWSVGVGLALCRRKRTSALALGSPPVTEDGFPLFFRSWLWRAGAGGEGKLPLSPLAGLSGSAIGLYEQHKTWGVIGFQNFEVRDLETDTDNTYFGAEEVEKRMRKGLIGFHGSLILPKELKQDYEIANPSL